MKSKYRINYEKIVRRKKVESIEVQACPDHIHMPVSIPLYLSIAHFLVFFKARVG